MSDISSTFDAALGPLPETATADPAPVQIATNLLPWGDLQAQGLPEKFLQLDTRFIPVIAVLAGQSAIGPKLIATDARGFFGAQLDANPQTIIVTPAAAVSLTAAVQDPTHFTAGAVVEVTTLGAPGQPQVLVVDSVDADVLTFRSPIVRAQASGDVVRLVPQMGIGGFPAAWLAASQIPFGTPVLGAAVHPLALDAAFVQNYLHSIVATIVTAAAGQTWTLEDSAGAVLARGSAAVIGDFPRELHGSPVTPGLGFSIRVPAGCTMAVSGAFSVGAVSPL